ncbi:MAG: hypothetical protein J0L94_00055 [Rhodothermia bacterium]|nr:hypothetical protein [Rhodothermia bacterium]
MHFFKQLVTALCSIIFLSGMYQDTWAQNIQNPAHPQYDIIALRVAFQPDTTRFTTGDGTFSDNLWKGLTPKIDPLPHNDQYFEAHLQFLKNYIHRVSDGKTTIRTHLLPEVVQVSKQMGDYAPTGRLADSNAERAKLAALVKEAWQLAHEKSGFSTTGLDPARTMFVLFHAGAGRDIELVGTTLLKTPQDLPSLFFNEASLKQLRIEEVYFKGFKVNHTAVLPETETRLGYDSFANKPFLVELSINGLLAASFLNFLGVPDLFDTLNGKTAVGSFCVMDGEGIFAYNGLFPPEPSAWVKYYLGWTIPKTINAAYGTPQTVELLHASDASSSEILKIPLSNTEYFLVENRQRDPERNGITVHLQKPNGQIETQTFTNQDKTFSRTDQSGFSGGTVIGVDNYDWALPGGVDRAGNNRMGGILIWHIDEAVLADRMADNRVNTDENRRGIDLEEADGAQDIGVASFPCNDAGDNNILRGSYDDFWYANNPVNCVIDGTAKPIGQYLNELGPTTRPNSETNTGAKTGIHLSGFSESANVMRFVVSRSKSPTYLQQGFYQVPTSFKTTNEASYPVKANVGNTTWTLTPDLKNQTYNWHLNETAGSIFDPKTYLPEATSINGFPILAQLGAGQPLVAITTVGNKLIAFNTHGAMVAGFPINMPTSSPFQPLLIHFKDQKLGTVVVAGRDGNLYGYDLDQKGKLHEDFPLAAGGTFSHHPKANMLGISTKTTSDNGQYWQWENGRIASVWWGELFYDTQNSNTVFINSPTPPTSESLLVDAETYNWPNPVRAGNTHLRLACTEKCDAEILITDLVGLKISTMTLNNIKAHVPYEAQWTADVPNGIYLARVKVTTGQKTAYKIVRMAVIKV